MAYLAPYDPKAKVFKSKTPLGNTKNTYYPVISPNSLSPNQILISYLSIDKAPQIYLINQPLGDLDKYLKRTIDIY